MKAIHHLLQITLAALAITSFAQVPAPAVSAAKSGGGALTGAGSSFVYPVMSKWASVYHEKTKVQVNYQSIGSGAGIKQFAARTVDFGATDSPMTADEMKQVPGGVALHVPVILGAVAISYNLPENTRELSFSGAVLADILMGKITKWNDEKIKAENPDAKLPDASIVVAHRSDGSGTTFIVSDYLSKTSQEWKKTMGAAKSLNWPVGIGGKGNEGVAALITRTPNSIGYVEVVYALQSKMPVASIRNSAGKIIAPSVESVTAAAAQLKDIPDDLRMSITNAPGETAYPISGMVWVLARPDSGAGLRSFLEWVLSDEAQGLAAPLQYSKLPSTVVSKARANVAKIK